MRDVCKSCIQHCLHTAGQADNSMFNSMFFFLSLSPKELKVANVSYKETATNTDPCSQNSLMLSDDSRFSFSPFHF